MSLAGKLTLLTRMFHVERKQGTNDNQRPWRWLGSEHSLKLAVRLTLPVKVFHVERMPGMKDNQQKWRLLESSKSLKLAWKLTLALAMFHVEQPCATGCPGVKHCLYLARRNDSE